MTSRTRPAPRAGFVYLIIAITSICYWVQGNGRRKEWEEEHAT